MRILFFLFTLLIAVLPFGARVKLIQFTPGFHEYETIFLYGSDILLIAIALLSIGKYGRALFPPRKNLALALLAAFLVTAFLSVLGAPAPGLAFLSSIRLVLLILFTLTIPRLLTGRRRFERILLLVVLGAVVQSMLAIAQFKFQHNLGLKLLGESPISLADPGTSKIAVGGAHLIRAYGTFPHPNVLAAFLLVGLLALFHFYLHTMREREMQGGAAQFLGAHLYRRVLISMGIFTVAIGLTLTFSRAAWLTAFFATLPFVLSGFRTFESGAALPPRNLRRLKNARSVMFLTILLMVNYAVFAVLGWAVFPRAQISRGEAAVTDRIAYGMLGLRLIRERPLGVGIGNQVLYAVQQDWYRPAGFTEHWEWEPVHNLYLLMANEIGVVGLITFLALLYLIAVGAFRSGFPLETITTLTLLSAFLLIGLVDHFLWTTEQGRLMLWLAIGLALAVPRMAPATREANVD